MLVCMQGAARLPPPCHPSITPARGPAGGRDDAVGGRMGKAEGVLTKTIAILGAIVTVVG